MIKVDEYLEKLITTAADKGYVIANMKLTFNFSGTSYKIRFNITPYPSADNRRGPALHSMYGLPENVLKKIEKLEKL